MKYALILYVVEDDLVSKLRKLMFNYCSPNPCCSGRWSGTIKSGLKKGDQVILILVVVDNGLVLKRYKIWNKIFHVLILIVVDDGLVRNR